MTRLPAVRLALPALRSPFVRVSWTFDEHILNPTSTLERIALFSVVYRTAEFQPLLNRPVVLGMWPLVNPSAKSEQTVVMHSVRLRRLWSAVTCIEHVVHSAGETVCYGCRTWERP